MNTRTIALYKDDEEIVVDVQRVEEFAALGYVAIADEGPKDKPGETPEDKPGETPKDKPGETPEDKPEGDDGKPAGKGRGKGGK